MSASCSKRKMHLCDQQTFISPDKLPYLKQICSPMQLASEADLTAYICPQFHLRFELI